MLEAGVGEDALGDDLADTVAVELAGADGVAGAAPVQRRVAVGGLRHRADIDGLDVVGVGLREDGLDHVLRRSHVDFQGLFGEIVRRRGDHAAHVQHDVRAGDAAQHVVVVHQVAPHDTDFVRNGGQFLLILGTFARQDGHVILFGITEQLFKPFPSHGAGRAGQEHVFLHLSVGILRPRRYDFLGNREKAIGNRLAAASHCVRYARTIAVASNSPSKGRGARRAG